jgi:4-amino-4-deoxychorismate lyase
MMKTMNGRKSSTFFQETSMMFMTKTNRSKKRSRSSSCSSCSCSSSEEIPTLVLPGKEFLEKILESRKRNEDMIAFYSSYINAITTEPAAMVIMVDEHGFHRGHAVFDTCAVDVESGNAQDLSAHLERFQNSRIEAKIPLPIGWTIEDVENRVRETIKVARGVVHSSKEKQGLSAIQCRFYLCAGTGGFSLSLKECTHGSTFYCVCVKRSIEKTIMRSRGLYARTTPIAIKNKPFCTIKSTNYLQNAMIQNDAEENDCDLGIWVKNDVVLEGPSANVAFVDDENQFIAPKIDDVLDGVTMRRCFDFIEKGLLLDLGISSAIRKDCSFKALIRENRAKEAMMVGSVIQCKSIEKWDGILIGNKEYVVAERLKNLLEMDARGEK